MNTEGKKNSLKELLHALESQIKQQDRIISLQEETLSVSHLLNTTLKLLLLK